MTTSLVIYTAIFGDCKDRLYPLPWLDKIDCFAFVDGVKSPRKGKHGWIECPARFTDPNPRRRAREHKTMAHELFPDAKLSIWVDGTMTPHTDPRALTAKYLKDHDICTFRHSARTCIYQEAEMCVRNRKDDVATIREQIAGYHREGYPYHNGLAETMVVMRRHTPAIREFNELWYASIKHQSLRDQLSFNYCLWKLGLQHDVFHNYYHEQGDFSFRSHW